MLSGAPEQGKVKLLDQVREVIRLKHYSLRTEQTYLDWIKRFVLFHGKRHPKAMGAEEVTPGQISNVLVSPHPAGIWGNPGKAQSAERNEINRFNSFSSIALAHACQSCRSHLMK